MKCPIIETRRDDALSDYTCANGCGQVMRGKRQGATVIMECGSNTAPRPRREPCIHRGAQIDERVCESCQNKRIFIKVFACAIHGECSIATAVGVAVCRTCPDYQPQEAPPA